MLALAICAFAGIVAYIAGRRSLVAGIGVVLSVGYAYGIIRANVPQTASHFTFDGAVIGLYVARIFTRRMSEKPAISTQLVWWVALLVAWPTLLMAIPKQDWLVQVVGLRGSVFLLPFVLLGAQLDEDEKYRLALFVAVLNIGAFVFAAAEFRLGIEPFFPKSTVTQIIYASNDVAGRSAYRIPSSFISAHAYGGTMAVTLPLLIGAWLYSGKPATHKVLVVAAILAAAVGVFMSATRSHAFLLILSVAIATLGTRMTLLSRVGWLTFVAAVALLVSRDQRLQRFTLLGDPAAVVQRIGGSVNANFFRLAVDYPLGNGLGGGGTSMPYFLQNRVTNRVAIENEYGRIMLEQGVPGLLMWVAFVAWFLTRRGREDEHAWRMGRRLAWFVVAVSFASGLIGTGVLTSIPATSIVLLSVGWLASVQRRSVIAAGPRTAASPPISEAGAVA